VVVVVVVVFLALCFFISFVYFDKA
jgi:hypothetical protein